MSAHAAAAPAASKDHKSVAGAVAAASSSSDTAASSSVTPVSAAVAAAEIAKETERLATLRAKYPTLTVPAATDYTRALHLALRDRTANQNTFVFHADQVMRLLIEEAAALMPYRSKTVVTPTGAKFEGLQLATPVCAVPILRSGSVRTLQCPSSLSLSLFGH
jgi:hypothetical protein